MNIEEVVAYKCTNCGRVATNKKIAEDCCKPYNCRVCGKPTPRFVMECDDCIYEGVLNNENIEKVTHWDGYIYMSGYGYHRDVQELIEYCESESLEVPKYVLTCDRDDITLDIDTAIENMLMETDNYSERDLVDLDELISFVEEWNSRQNLYVHTANYKRVLLLEDN